MDRLAGSGCDEYYTPEYGVKPILKYIRKGSVVWCPFDAEQSNFVKMLQLELNCKVIATHIDDGKDFFKIDVPKCDYIVSNPPFSLKAKVLERLFEIGKPFAMLMSIQGLFESKKRFNMFKNNRFEIIYLSRRVWYMTDYEKEDFLKNASFLSVYVCSKMCLKRHVFEDIGKDDKNKKLKKLNFMQWLFQKLLNLFY